MSSQAVSLEQTDSSVKEFKSGFSLYYCSDGWGEVESLDWHNGCWMIAETSNAPNGPWGHREFTRAHTLQYGFLLRSFGLANWRDELPFEQLLFMSPAQLIAFRRGKEAEHLLEPIIVYADSMGRHKAEDYF